MEEAPRTLKNTDEQDESSDNEGHSNGNPNIYNHPSSSTSQEINNDSLPAELTDGVSSLYIDEQPDTSNMPTQNLFDVERRKNCWLEEEISPCIERIDCACDEKDSDVICSNCFLPQTKNLVNSNNEMRGSSYCNGFLLSNDLSQNVCACVNSDVNVPICRNCFLMHENLTLGCKRKSREDCYGLHMQMSESEELREESSKWLVDSPHCFKKPKIPFVASEQLLQPILIDNIENQSETELTDYFSDELELDEVNNHKRIFDNVHFLDLDSDILAEIEDSDTMSCPFDILPTELKLKIFSYFTQRQLCRYIAPVCSSWFQLSKDISFWQHLDTTNEYGDVSTELIVRVIISWCKNITKLELNKRDNISITEFREIFQNCPNIQHLSVAFCSQIDNDILALIGTYCKGLKGINLEGCINVTDTSFYKFIGLPLCCVNVSHCNMLSDDGGIFLVRNFNNLVEINFDGIQWMSEDFIKLLVENHHETLEQVFMDGENLGDDAVRHLSRCKQLKALSFSFCTLMTYHSVVWVGQCDKIQHLRLRKGSNFTNASLLNYLKNMSINQGLKFTYLNLAECTELSDKCLFYLSEKCPNLKILDLSWCWEVSDDGLAHILDNCSKLKELHLKGLHELYGTHFFDLPKSVPGLLLLDLSQCNKVQDELIKYVVDKMRELIVYNYYGEMVINARRHDVSRYLDK